MFGRILAIAAKEWIHIRRDPRTLYIALVLPLMLVLLFGYAINFDLDRIRTGVCDQDHSRESRALRAKLAAGDWFRIVLLTSQQRDLEEALDRGDIKIGIYIPNGYARQMGRGEIAHVGAILDGSDNNAAVTGINYLHLFFATYQRDLLRDYAARQGHVVRSGGPDPRPRILFNPDLKSRHFILPGIMVLVLAVIAAMLASQTVAREWERGTMEQLIATPVRSPEIVIGKVIPYTGISVVQTGLATALAVLVFGVPLKGGILEVFLTATLFAIGMLAFGVLLSAALRSQLPAMQASMMASLLPSVYLSDFVFPISSMPPLARLITYIVPARYFVTIVRTIFLKGGGPLAYWWELALLALFAILALTAASRKLVRRIG